MPLTISNTFAALALALAGTPAIAQKYTPPPPPLTDTPCKPTKKVPCPPPPAPAAAPAAGAFPFPGETQQDEGKPPTTPQTTAPAPGAFPFPGEPSPEAPATSPSSSSSSSSSSASDPAQDPDQPALKDEGTTGSTRFSRKRLPKVSVIDPDERGSKDIEVSRYYFSTGNFNAAYLRAKDAITSVPEDPEAHLALAEAAQRLKKLEEAAAEYNLTLKLDLSDQQKKSAQKGLTELASAQPKHK